MEVDASETEVEAIPSQQFGENPKLHPAAFFSQNRDFNWELLAVKLALEEWSYWLEGGPHPFTILTDHNVQVE